MGKFEINKMSVYGEPIVIDAYKSPIPSMIISEAFLLPF